MNPRFLLIIIIIPRQAHDSAGVTLFVPEKTSFFFCQTSPTLFSFELTYAVSFFSYPPMADSAVFPLYISSHVFIFLQPPPPDSVAHKLPLPTPFFPLFFFFLNEQTSL